MDDETLFFGVLAADLPLAANTPPSLPRRPLSSSLSLTHTHTSKLPRSLAPPGLFFAPLRACQIPPPTAPMPNAPPTSSRMRSGHGSRLWSTEGPPCCGGGGGAAIC